MLSGHALAHNLRRFLVDLVIPNLIMGAIAGRISGIVWNMMTTEDVLVDPGLFS